MARKAVPANQNLEEVEIISDPEKAYIFSGSDHAEDEGWTAFSEVEYSNTDYVNPYTVEILGVIDKETNWIWPLPIMHQQHLLQYEIGHLIVELPL